ncbi:hypothetical protein C2845_PM08G15130 [Panicum miliaceum]|uniref:Uncharacterized protein n=1 Tax=Panicum miliaceum TaxID=4540 RepID=A0A3L6R0J2_PANMI|nr:hypothetical protein C2845_PM08G15130 [Panicum miliaceum]
MLFPCNNAGFFTSTSAPTANLTIEVLFKFNAERRRQKARDRYASMTDEQKAQRNAKRRENYHRKKAESRAANMTPETTDIGAPVDSPTNKPPETPIPFHPAGQDDVGQYWLHQNDTYTSLHDFKFVEPIIGTTALSVTGCSVEMPREELKREKERKQYANMSELAKQEKLQDLEQQSAMTEMLTRSKIREATNGGLFHSELINFYNSFYNFHADKIFFFCNQEGVLAHAT